MKLLYGYLQNYWRLVALALVLATINQVFSLLDPLIFRYVIDNYATRFASTHRRVLPGRQPAAGGGRRRGVRLARGQELPGLLHQSDHAAARRPALFGRHRHSLELPYSVFEDQRSGETLGKLQKVRADVEKLISTSINVLFTSLVGIIFVMVYAFSVHWLIAPVTS
jgi:ATP-binding cassette subfamily B protein